MARKKLYELTPEHRAMLKPWADRWIANAMSTAAMTDEDRAACVEAVNGMYAAAKLPPPRVVFVPSPFVAAFAAGFAGGIWELRKGGAATRAATWAATEDATRDATSAATWAATWAATRDATWAATRDATRAATWAATEAAARAATEAAASAATRDATEAATWDATEAATWDATWAAASAATRDATRAATWAATWDATEAATSAATRDATRAAARAATRAATWDAKHWYKLDLNGVRRVAQHFGGNNAAFLLSCAEKSWQMRHGGNQWSGYDAYLSFFQDVAGLKLPEYAAYQPWRTLAERSGPRYLHPEFCIISDRPERLLVDDRNRPHAVDGPFCRWRDGLALYSVHGVRVPMWIVENPERITVASIDAEENSEVRRVMIELMGWERYGKEAGAETIEHDEAFGTLKRRVMRGETMLWVEVVNHSAEPDGTFRRYVLPVHPECCPLPDPEDPNGDFGPAQPLTARNAVASTFGLTGEQYRPSAQS